MGVQQMNSASDRYEDTNQPEKARSCMAIVWVHNDKNQFDRTQLLEAIKGVRGVSDANFGRDKPAILMIDYCVKELSAVNLIQHIRDMGLHAKIVGC